MSVLRQKCPSCDRELELPADAIGRTAQCPACQATFQVTAPENDSGSPTQTRTSLATENPYAGPLVSGSATSAANPYQPGRSVDIESAPVAHSGSIQIVPRSVEEVISATSSICIARWVPLILMAVLMFTVIFIAIAIPVLLIVILAETLSELAAAIGVAAVLPMGLMISAYLTVGTSRVCLAVARNEPSPLSQMLPPMALVIRFAGGATAVLLALGVMTILYGGIAFGLTLATGADIAGPVFAIIGILLMFAVSLLAQWLMWPWIFVVSDGKGSAIGSIATANQNCLAQQDDFVPAGHHFDGAVDGRVGVLRRSAGHHPDHHVDVRGRVFANDQCDPKT